jgi:hypothetical protein
LPTPTTSIWRSRDTGPAPPETDDRCASTSVLLNGVTFRGPSSPHSREPLSPRADQATYLGSGTSGSDNSRPEGRRSALRSHRLTNPSPRALR